MSFRMKYTAIRTNAHCTGINSPNNQSILFLSNSCVTCSLAFQLLQPPSWILNLFSRFSGSFKASTCYIVSLPGPVKTPGEKYLAEISHFSVEETPGAPVRPEARTKNRRKRYFYIGEFGSLTPGAQCGPGNLSTGYPHVVHNGGVWEFEPKLPLGV